MGNKNESQAYQHTRCPTLRGDPAQPRARRGGDTLYPEDKSGRKGCHGKSDHLGLTEMGRVKEDNRCTLENEKEKEAIKEM